MAVITVPRALREKLGEEGADAFVEVMHSVETESRKDLATKEDLVRSEGSLREDLAKFEGAVREEFAKVREEFAKIREEFARFEGAVREDFAKLDGNLRVEIEKSKSDVIKWVAAMLIAQSAVIAALVRLFSH
jgi:hypothetical protein